MFIIVSFLTHLEGVRMDQSGRGSRDNTCVCRALALRLFKIGLAKFLAERLPKIRRRHMTFEVALAWFGFLTLMILGFEIMYTYATQGFGFGFSANRPMVEVSPFGQRLKNVYSNQVEAAAYGVPILAAAALFEVQDTSAMIAAVVFVVFRALYAALYLTGINFVRVPAFVGGNLSLLFILFVIAFR
jgi:uncharacterized MAPEG superfamily protein